MRVRGTDCSDYIARLDAHIRRGHGLEWVRHIRLGEKIVRLECFSREFAPLAEKQLAYTLIDDYAGREDATIAVWKESDLKALPERLLDGHEKARARVEKLVSRRGWADLDIAGGEGRNGGSSVSIFPETGFANAFEPASNTYYYGAEDLSPEEFIKQGHIFVQLFNKIIKSPEANLAHGAVVGLDGAGVLMCARGQRGKSTLAVLAMMEGFEYVSDDYLILEKSGGELLASPIYSIITLSPRMYNELYDDFRGKFVSNNARRDKYVLDISAYHGQFREKYPIRACLFPEIVPDAEPSVAPCGKGRAITQLVHSTINQVGDQHDIATVRKLMDFVRDFEFYQINLSPDIRANAQCLRKFLEEKSK